MLQVKTNYKSKYTNMTCRGCGINIETQCHVLGTCPQLNPNDTTKVYITDIFDNHDRIKLAKTAENIEKTIKNLTPISK